MARKHRIQVAGGLYHIVARGNRRQPIFAGEDDRLSFATLLAHVVGRFDWECQAHCLMTNHYHLAIHTSRPNIGRGMARLTRSMPSPSIGDTDSAGTSSRIGTGRRWSRPTPTGWN